MVKIITRNYYITCIGINGKRQYFHDYGDGNNLIMKEGKESAEKFTKAGAEQVFEWCKENYPNREMEILNSFAFRVII